MDLRLLPERRLIMTFALRQALEMLQMPQVELSEWLQNEIEKNPLLEITPPRGSLPPYKELIAPSTLHDHILAQIRENFSLDSERAKAEELLSHLDEKGFLVDVENIDQKILSILQTFDPPGIFARNLQESLLIQLRNKGKSKTLAFSLVETCFDELLHGRYGAIKKKLECTELSEAISTLARLSMRPTQGFDETPTTLIIPDLKVTKIEGGWTLELVEDELPNFNIRSEYLSIHAESEEEKECLQEYKTQAKWLTRSLDRRRVLLRAIGRILITKQSRYLSEKGALTPLTIREMAEALEIHESTLSRALSGKYIMTPRGTIPLRSLITATPKTETAKEILLQLIHSENKTSPLTDDDLAQCLKKKGFPIARRTVAKYRTQLKIGSATQRKHILGKK